jgi:ubiquinol-cytochrome c reductase cytochrome c subunit
MRRLLIRWLTHRSRIPRGLRIAAACVMGALALASFASSAPGDSGFPSNGPGGPVGTIPNPASKSPEPPGIGNPTKSFPRSATLEAEGLNLYQQHCSSCHGANLNGVPGTAPSLHDVGAGPVDFYLSTGRMPLKNPRDEPMRAPPLFNRTQINALIAYITKFGGPPAPTADPSAGDLSEGRHAFTVNCAGCHQMVARGGMFVGAWVPDLGQATAQQVAEAVRMGPYLMPHFDSTQINQHELDSIARYVLWTHHPDNAGGWAIYNIGPIPEGLVAWFLGLGTLIVVARLIGERTDERTGSSTPTSDGG